MDLRARQGRRLAVLDERRHRPVHRVRRRVPDPAGVRGRAAGARARREGRGVERGGRARGRRGGRARDHRADAVDAALLLERPGRRALPRELLRHVPRRLAPRRLAEDHRAGDGRDLRPLGLDDQPPGHPHGDERDLQRGRGGPGGARQPRDRRRRLDAAVRRDARRADGRGEGRDPPPGAGRAARRATCRTRSSGSTRCRAPSAARSSRCR